MNPITLLPTDPQVRYWPEWSESYRAQWRADAQPLVISPALLARMVTYPNPVDPAQAAKSIDLDIPEGVQGHTWQGYHRMAQNDLYKAACAVLDNPWWALIGESWIVWRHSRDTVGIMRRRGASIMCGYEEIQAHDYLAIPPEIRAAVSGAPIPDDLDLKTVGYDCR